MEDRIKVLFHNKDTAGVNYYRTQTPAIQLERDHSDKFHVDINPELDFNDPKTIEYLKSFDIINYHRSLIHGTHNMLKLANELKKAGVVLVMDIDDYWTLDKSHPFYNISMQQQLYLEIIDNLKIADYVTTTTDLFAAEIKRVSGKDDDHVIVLPNSVDPTWMKQFRDERVESKDGRVRITYMAGSSHMGDVQQLRGMVNLLNADSQTKDKFKIIVAGWDTEGFTTEVQFNKEFANALQKKGLWDMKMVKAINKSGGNIDLIPNLPSNIIEEFRGKVFFSNRRPINSNESVYLEYEKILTDNYRIIKDENYLKWLEKFERDEYSDEVSYSRRWTQKANIYANVLNETDISIAPLANHMFNRMKSNLKQVECWTRKIPIVCSDVAPYNVDGINGVNCLLVPEKKNAERYWYKALKSLILDADLRKQIGQGLYDTFSEKYNLKNVTNKRAKFYESLIVEEVNTK